MPNSARNSDRVLRGQGAAIRAVETITRPRQAPPIVVLLCLWRWRWEIACVVGLAFVYYDLVLPRRWSLQPLSALFVMTAPVPIMLMFRPSRRFMRNRLWCVITRHRVRVCLAEMRTLNWSGKLPLIVGCFSTKAGEVVWLWMRPGLSVEDLQDKSQTIAAACWARRARISRAQRNAALVRIEIDRRDPVLRRRA